MCFYSSQHEYGPLPSFQTPDPSGNQCICNPVLFLKYNPLLVLSGKESLDLLLDALLLLGLGELGGSVLLGDSLPLLLGLLGLRRLSLLEGVLTDSGVGLGVELLKGLSLDIVLDVHLELALVTLLIVVGEGLHVLSDVTAVDVVAENVSVELLGLHVVTGEALLGVGDEDTTVRGTLKGTEDTGTSGSAGKTNIEEGLEGAALLTVVLSSLGESELTIGLLNTSEGLVEAELLEGTAGDQKTGGVGSSPVGKTVVDAVGAELVGVSSAEDLVASDLRGDELHDDVLVGEADNKSVLRSIVLVLGLGDEALAGVVVGLALSAALELGLEAAVGGNVLAKTSWMNGLNGNSNEPVVSVALHQLVESLFHKFPESAICASECSS